MAQFDRVAYTLKYGTGSVNYKAQDGAKVTIKGMPKTMTPEGLVNLAVGSAVKYKMEPVVINGKEVNLRGAVDGFKGAAMVEADFDERDKVTIEQIEEMAEVYTAEEEPAVKAKVA